jgi:hypothetical protein
MSQNGTTKYDGERNEMVCAITLVEDKLMFVRGLE